MSDILHIAEPVDLLCKAAKLDPSQVAHVNISADGYISFEMLDGSAIVFLWDRVDGGS